MKHVDEYRDPRRVRSLAAGIRSASTRRHVVMDVCGGQTHNLVRSGIEEELADVVELIHGPGCPVCVTPASSIDFAQSLAQRDNVLLASFGDMMRVPGSDGSLLDIRGRGGNSVAVYSPLDAVELAARYPDQEVVFFAVGFETTAPSTALAVLQAEQRALKNFSLLVAHVRVLPAMQAVMDDPHSRVEAFLAAGHVCTVTGFSEYPEFSKRYSVPVAITGFEPVDLLLGIENVVRQLERGQCKVENVYPRSVRREGNPQAMALVDQVYKIVDCPWRGFDVIPGGGYRLRSRYRRFDALSRFSAPSPLPIADQPVCRSGEVLTGRMKPDQCDHFSTACTPDQPLGAPMVSDEGVCAAYFRNRRLARLEEA